VEALTEQAKWTGAALCIHVFKYSGTRVAYLQSRMCTPIHAYMYVRVRTKMHTVMHNFLHPSQTHA